MHSLLVFLMYAEGGIALEHGSMVSFLLQTRPASTNGDRDHDHDTTSKTTVIVRNLSHDTTEDTLRRVFCVHGSVADVRMLEPKGIALVKFSSEESLPKALELHLASIDGRLVTVEAAQARPPSGGSGGVSGGGGPAPAAALANAPTHAPAPASSPAPTSASPAPAAAAPVSSVMFGRGPAATLPVSAPAASSGSGWKCPCCDGQNTATSSSCDTCLAARPAAKAAAPLSSTMGAAAPSSTMPVFRTFSFGSGFSATSIIASTAAATASGAGASGAVWKCALCDTKNGAAEVTCGSCMGPHSTKAAAVAPSATAALLNAPTPAPASSPTAAPSPDPAAVLATAPTPAQASVPDLATAAPAADASPSPSPGSAKQKRTSEPEHKFEFATAEYLLPYGS